MDFQILVSEILCHPPHGLKAVGNIDFLVNIVDMGLDGMEADAKLVGNAFVGGPGSNFGENLFFPGSKRRIAILNSIVFIEAAGFSDNSYNLRSDFRA